jgi:DNA-binding IscR family transcriptional regulator
MWRPAEPKTSPTKRMFTEEVYMLGRWRNAGVDSDTVIGSGAGCVSFLSMAQSGRFQLSVRVLAVLASEPDAMHTSAAIAEALKESAVMVRRTFLLLHKAGLIEQKKGPHGGAKLKIPAKQIGLGDVFEASAGDWLSIEDKAVSAWIKKVRGDAVSAMNEHSLAGVVKRLKKTK